MGNITFFLILVTLLLVVMCIIYSFINRVKGFKEVNLYLYEVDSDDESIANSIYRLDDRNINLRIENHQANIRIIEDGRIILRINGSNVKYRKGEIFKFNGLKYKIDDAEKVNNFSGMKTSIVKTKTEKYLLYYKVICGVILAIIIMAYIVMFLFKFNKDSEAIFTTYTYNKDIIKIIVNNNESEIKNMSTNVAKIVESKLANKTEEKNSVKEDYEYGISVSYHQSEIKWDKINSIKNSDFALIRLGRRGWGKEEENENSDKIAVDEKFELYIQEALQNGVDVSVYFYSAAINIKEVHEEFDFIMNQMQNYSKEQVSEIAIFWEKDGSDADSKRHSEVSDSESIVLMSEFCKLIDEKGYTPLIGGNARWIDAISSDETLSQYSFWIYHFEGDKKYPSHDKLYFDRVSDLCKYVQYEIAYDLEIFGKNTEEIYLVKRKVNN